MQIPRRPRSTSPALAFLLLLAALCPLAAPSQTEGALNAKDQEAVDQAHAYLASQSANGSFRGSVLIGIHGKIAFERSYGLANEEWNIPNTPITKFRIASLTKQFTAASILLLEERGKLSVKDPVSKYIPNLPEPWQPITLHQLLTHTSGIPAPSPDSAADKQFDRTGATPQQLLQDAQSKPLDFPPGSRLAYSNRGYILLGMVIEKVSGQTYADFLHDNIFSPLGMTGSGYDVATALLLHRASGYSLQDGHLANADFVDMSVPFSAGGLYSTVEDLYRWNEALATPGKLLSAKSLAQMFAVYPETSTNGGLNYGYGTVITHRFGKVLYSHGGGVTGFQSSIQRYPHEHICIVILSNLDPAEPGPSDPWKLSDRIASYLFHQPLPTTPATQ